MCASRQCKGLRGVWACGGRWRSHMRAVRPHCPRGGWGHAAAVSTGRCHLSRHPAFIQRSICERCAEVEAASWRPACARAAAGRPPPGGFFVYADPIVWLQDVPGQPGGELCVLFSTYITSPCSPFHSVLFDEWLGASSRTGAARDVRALCGGAHGPPWGAVPQKKNAPLHTCPNTHQTSGACISFFCL